MYLLQTFYYSSNKEDVSFKKSPSYRIKQYGNYYFSSEPYCSMFNEFLFEANCANYHRISLERSQLGSPAI